MKKVEQLIIENNLIKPHEVVAVACSGGQDSMCLLNVLNNLTAKLNFTLIAVAPKYCAELTLTAPIEFW